MKKILSVVLTAALLLSLGSTVVFASAPALNTAKIGNSTANLVKFDMSGNKAVLTLGQGSVAKDMSFSEHIATATQTAGSAPALSFNGTYFNAYYKTSETLSYPDNCALIQQTVMSNGKVVIGGGESKNMMLGFTADGRAFVDRVSVCPRVTIAGQIYTPWAVNQYYGDSSAIMLFTEELGYPVTVPQDATVLWLVGNMVSMTGAGGTVSVPKGAMALVFNAGAWASAHQWNDGLKAGASAELTVDITTQDADAQEAWSAVVTAVAGNPALVENGADITDSISGTENKLATNTVAQRTFAAQMKDGQLMIGTVSASPKQLAQYLVSAGAENAVCLDGGASSAMYLNGKTVTNAGRKLANVIHIIEDESAAPPKDPADGASAWAKETVSGAIEAGFVPEELQSKYQSEITRLEFCRMAMRFLTVRTNVNALLAESDISAAEAGTAFSDCADQSVLLCYRLHIINGYPDGTFRPSGLITRQEAAKILSIIANYLDLPVDDAQPELYADDAEIHDWAKEFVYFCTRAGILNGMATGFSPLGHFTREQAIATIWRMR